VLELGSTYFTTPTYQIDRGIFENYLGQHARAAGVGFIDGSLSRLRTGQDEAVHTVSCEQNGEAVVVQARWLVDASGRAGLLKRKLDLAQVNDHDVNSAWSASARRSTSTNGPAIRSARPLQSAESLALDEHLVARLLGLAHPAGVRVAFCRHRGGCAHPSLEPDQHLRARTGLAAAIPASPVRRLESKRERLQDFVCLKHFSYGCKKVFSETAGHDGRVGSVPRPFYSPAAISSPSRTPTSRSSSPTIVPAGRSSVRAPL